MTTIDTTGALLREYGQLATASGLHVDVPSDGALGSTLAIVAEAPGETEVMRHLPLVGASGRLLWDVLRKYGINRTDCFITNVVKRQVSTPRGDTQRDPVSSGELVHWEQLLLWELAQLPNLKYVLALGNYALRALSKYDKITNWRGSVVPLTIGDRQVQCLLTLNPAFVLREPKNEITFHFDIGRLHDLMHGKWTPHEVRPRINPSFVDAARWIEKMHDEHKPVGIDIETYRDETTCVGLANDPHEGMCIAMRSLQGSVYSTREERILLRRLSRLLTAPDVQLVAQNGAFDLGWLWYKDRVKAQPLYFDTMLAHHTLYPRLPHSLAYQVAQYTTHPYYKDEGKDWRAVGDINQFWEYNVKDACLILPIMQAELAELRDQGMEHFFFNHVMRLQPELIGMTVGGIKCDLDLKESLATSLRHEVEAKRERFLAAARHAVGDPTYVCNPRSPMQIGDLLFRRLKLVGRGSSTDKENRAIMLRHPRTNEAAQQVLLTLDSYAKDEKFLGTYAEMRVDPDGRIRCAYKQHGVQSAPGRLSSAATPWNTGMNLQNQPVRAQAMFVADPGYEFSYFDLSQAEARVVAVKAKVQRLLHNFAEAAITGFDVHRMNASTIFRVPIEDIPSFDFWVLGKTTDDPEMHGKPTRRYLGKRCVHGLNYRMMYERLAVTCNIPLPQALGAYSAYHTAFPEIKEWWDATTKEVTRTRMLFNAYGRRLYILERLEGDALDAIVAFYPQSTIGDKVSRCIYLCHNDPDWPRTRAGVLEARIVLNVHDALVGLNRPQHGEAVRAVMKRHAEEPVLIDGTELVIPAELKRSVPDEQGFHRWSRMEKLAT